MQRLQQGSWRTASLQTGIASCIRTGRLKKDSQASPHRPRHRPHDMVPQALRGGPKWSMRVLHAEEGEPIWGLRVLHAEEGGAK